MRSPRKSARPNVALATVCVVDPAAADSQEWQNEADALGVELRICGSAEEALRLARAQAIDLWVVNTHLPGLSGFELCTMLKARNHRTSVYLMADEYSPEAERAALQSRATLFGCKGAHAAWLGQWRQNSAQCRATLAE